ncbi:MAG: 1-acyl-sn-glycerol-3-phosphate acyltransferase, partial [Planctomycetes bacterium]|nr:1-acyl-sn-glycerol-3-phosphate acyltransferase [Planctomycetota bacterium]
TQSIILKNSSVSSARLRLLALWIAVLTRAIGGSAVLTYALLKASNGSREHTLGFLFTWLGLAAVPAFALAPLIGALACCRGRWMVMVLATLAGLGVIAWSSFEEYRYGETFWPSCIAVIAFESAFFAGCRYSILPEAARTARFSLNQLFSLFTLALTTGMLVGLWIGTEKFQDGKPGLPVPLQFGHVGYGLALIAILLARFPVEKPTRFNDGLMMPFLKTASTIFRSRNARNSMLTLWGLFAISLAMQQWMIPRDAQYGFFLALTFGLVVGGLQSHVYRCAAVVPYASIGLAICTIAAVVSGDWPRWSIPSACLIGLMVPSLLTWFMINQPDGTRGHGGALLQAGCSMVAAGFLFFLMTWMSDPPKSRPVVGNLILALSLVGMIGAWIAFFRPVIEWTMEVILCPLYRIKATGPGVPLMPWKGPVLVIGNHSAWFDPLWVAKILPFPIVPMMTSRFYDKPVISWFMRRVIGTVRVPDVAMRKEAPELKDAVQKLDEGVGLILFPEGWLRRKEAQELRRFGRGIWHILKARPQTPIIACWIEGGWGSKTSYFNGPPMANKKWDFWRTIRIGVLEPFTVDPAVLKSHLETRTAMMKKVLEARIPLGLPMIDPFKIQHSEDEGEGEEKS